MVAARVRLPVLDARPRTRADCELPNAQRPCPWVSCRHHVMPVVERADGSLQVGDLELAPGAGAADVAAFVDAASNLIVSRRRDSCVLDVVDRERDGTTLDVAGKVFGLTRERIRQIEKQATRSYVRELRRARVTPR